MIGFPFEIWVRNALLQRVGLLDEYETLDMTLKLNDVSPWSLKVDRRNRLAPDLLQPGAGIVVTRNGSAILSGPRTEDVHQVDADKNALTIQGVDDTAWLARRLASPDPSESFPPYITEHDQRIGVASTVVRQFADFNLGPNAVSIRKIFGLMLGSDPVYGSTITKDGRWQTLLQLMQESAEEGLVNGLPVGFKILQVGTGLQFIPYAPVDRSAAVIFSYSFENLAHMEYKRTAPTCTYVYVGGEGEGTARTIFERGDSAGISEWGRIEQFVDQRNATTNDELKQVAIRTLAEGASKSSLSITPIDTDQLSFGVHYGLGDRVTVVLDKVGADAVGPGDVIKDVVRECQLTLSNGYTVEPTIGGPGTTGTPVKLFGTIKRMAAQIADLQRR